MFRTALAEIAQRGYSNLEREDKYYKPEFAPILAPPCVILDADETRALNLATIEKYAMKVAKMESDSIKLYGLIHMHLSIESKDEIAQDPEYAVWSKAMDAEKLWQTIVKAHNVDCVSNKDEVKELTARKSYQNMCQRAFETLVQYSEWFHDIYRGYANMLQLPAGPEAVVD